jgi:hypothetical protein
MHDVYMENMQACVIEVFWNSIKNTIINTVKMKTFSNHTFKNLPFHNTIP